MGIALILVGLLGCLLLALFVRIGLHEFCHRFDGEKARRSRPMFLPPEQRAPKGD